MVYGIEIILKVDVIIGFGNIYVILVKKIVYGIVGIDFLVGFLEVLIIVDFEVNLVYVVVDMLV